MKKYQFLLTCLFLFASVAAGQQFEKSLLIDMPGDNFAFSVFGAQYYIGQTNIIWINKKDSNYKIYLKKIFPDEGENQLVYSSTNELQNPHISAGLENMWIAWQEKAGEVYQVCVKKIGNTSDTTVNVVDSMNNDPQMTLSQFYMAWIKNGDLLLTGFYDTTHTIVKFDSIDCSMPSLPVSSGLHYTSIVYLQKKDDDNNVYYGYIDQNVNLYEKKIICSGINNRPVFGIEQNMVVFEHMGDSSWNIGRGNAYLDPFIIKSDFNCRNPHYYDYPMTTKRLNDDESTQFFFVYDSDSLAANKEIIYTSDFYFNDTVRNLSELPGDDTNPWVSYIYQTDTPYVAVYWLNKNEGRGTIWMARTLYNPLNTSVVVGPDIPKEYNISAYPNPFNLSTMIEYKVAEQGRVNIKVFDILGKELALLVDEVKMPGIYKSHFNGSGFPSGTYFIRMQAQGRQFVRKIILMK